MNNILTFLKRCLLFLVFTIVSQIGGLVYLLYLAIAKKFIKREGAFFKTMSMRIGLFMLLYLSISLLLVPRLAKLYGRESLPWYASEQIPLQPHTILTCLLNRHYVERSLKQMILETSVKIREEYPGTKTNYLDANFPFWDGFPLLPHLSHNDGKKLDIDYIYRDTKTGKRVLKGPSFTGYGICEEPEAGEIDQPLICEEKAYWQYSLLRSLTPQHSKGKYKFDPDANKLLLQMLAHHPDCSKIFIEPHLKQRLGLEKYNKIRFHGCQSVRHDDHIHMQL